MTIFFKNDYYSFLKAFKTRGSFLKTIVFENDLKMKQKLSFNDRFQNDKQPYFNNWQKIVVT